MLGKDSGSWRNPDRERSLEPLGQGSSFPRVLITREDLRRLRLLADKRMRHIENGMDLDKLAILAIKVVDALLDGGTINISD